MSLARFWVRTTLLFFTVPFFYILIFVLPYHNHLVFNLCTVAATIAGALEVENLFRKKGIPISRFIFSFLSGTLLLATYLEIAGIIERSWYTAWFIIVVSLVLLRAAWIRNRSDIQSLLQLVSSSLFILIYPALFTSFIVKLSSLEYPSIALLFFFSLVFGNDIMAYLAGKFLGKKSRLKLLISPNKTGIGFIAGFICSIAVAVLFKFLFPHILTFSTFTAGLFGAVMGAAVILGDLVESALKRSAHIKDSSSIIPGRGGMLDSLDSMIISAPIFYFVLNFIFRVN